MARRRYGKFQLSNGGEIYIPPHAENIADLKTNWNDIDVYDVSTTQEYAVGTLLRVGTRVWAYGEFGGTTAAGDLVQSEAPAAAHDILAAVAGSAGDNTISITSPASGTDDIIANEYAGGILLAQINGSPGYAYNILSHPALDISEAGTLVVTLYPNEGTAVAVAATDDFVFIKNPWKEVIEHPAIESHTAPACGVSAAVGADGSFGWFGVKGPHAVSTIGTVVIGEEVVPAGTAGGVMAREFEEATDADRDRENVGAIGRVADVGATTGFSLINLYGFGLV